VAVRRPLGLRIVWIIFKFSGFAVNAHKSRVPGNPDVSAGILSKAVSSKLRPGRRVVGPSSRARVHFTDLQAARIDVPNVSIFAEVRVVESALAIRERRNVVLD